MAKKFGKFLLFTAAAGAAVAGAYYYLQKKSHNASDFDFDEDDDYDDFSEDLEDTNSSRSYVPLNKETAEETEHQKSDVQENESDFSSLAEQVQEKKDEKVEEFFDEDEDASLS